MLAKSLFVTNLGKKTFVMCSSVHQYSPSNSWSSDTLKDMIISRMRDWSSDDEDMSAVAMRFYNGNFFLFEVADV